MHKIHHFLKTILHHIKNFTLNTPSAILIGSVIIAVSIVTYGFIIQGETTNSNTTFSGKDIDKTDYVEGNSKSNIFFVEYSDPECPYCASVHPTVKQLRTEYADKISFIYRHFPLTQIHPHAFDESKAIICAGNIGGSKKYYEYIDALFGYKVSNKTTQLPVTGKEDLARGIGLDINLFSSCMVGENVGNLVTASMADGVKAGVQGTPTTFILKKEWGKYRIVATIDGARPYEYFKAAIDEALK